MIIIKQGDQLTLINPVRLNASELSKLDQLGQVKDVVRLGDFHGLDDPFYIDRYAATFWCQSGQSTYKLPAARRFVEAGPVTPIENSEFFVFEGALFPEAALLLKDSELLVTTDSLQHITDWSYTTLFTKFVLRFMGFRIGLLIGGPWLKRVTPKGGSMKPDFERLLQLEFDNLIAAHGGLLRGGAKERVRNVVHATFAKAN